MSVELTKINADLMKATEGTGLTPYDQVPTSPEFPCIYCGLPTEMQDFASTGSCSVSIPLTVAVSRSDEETAQTQLTDWLNIDLISRFIRFQSQYWEDIAFISINHFRSVTFGNAECLAADLNFAIRST